MGKFNLTLEEFEEFSKLSYQLLMDGLDEAYCWKCPMRSTSNRAHCKELHAWIKIQKTLEDSVMEYLSLNTTKLEMDSLTGRFLEKRFKKEETQDLGTLIILNSDKNMGYGIKFGGRLIVRPNPKNVKKGDIVLLPQKTPCPVSWFFKAGLLAGVPFKTAQIERIYHKGPSWYSETDGGEHVPVALIMGVILKVIDPESDFFKEIEKM